MKNLLLYPLSFLCIIIFTAENIFPQSTSAHENPVIADAVPNIPEELFQTGKLSKYVALSVPDDDRWNPDGDDLIANGAVYAIAQTPGSRSCYLGGHFDFINGLPFKRIAFFRDEGKGMFSDIGGGIDGGDVYTIITVPNSDELYVGGNFTKAGNMPAKCIAHWTGTAWESLGSGTDSTVLALAIVANDLYVGGNFHNAGGKLTNFIARWDMVNKVWLPVIDGITIGLNGGVSALAVIESGDLLVGGGFTKAGTVAANKIAVLTSGTWSSLGSGVEGTNAFVSCIATGNGNRNYVGGNFQLAGGNQAGNFSELNGTTWTSFTDPKFLNGFDKPVYTLSTAGGYFLYAGGDFTKFGNITVNHVAQLQRSIPSISMALGSGLDSTCYALAGIIELVDISLSGWDQHLYAGGSFTQAGLKPSHSFAIWGAAQSGVKSNAQVTSQFSVRISPNPAQISSTVSFSLPYRAYISLLIIDALGREVVSLGCGWRSAGEQEISMDLQKIPNGFYYCILQAEGQSVSTPFVVLQ